MSILLQENEKSKASSNLQNDELTIKIASSHFQESPMNEQQKREARENAPSLFKLFESTLKEKGEYNLEELKWNGDDELELEYLSNNALYSFVMEAEKLGKKISFEKVHKIRVTD